jgi:hypothetical protein
MESEGEREKGRMRDRTRQQRRGNENGEDEEGNILSITQQWFGINLLQ